MKRNLFKIINLVAFIVFALGFNGALQETFADESSDGWGTFELMPFRYITAKGDAAKFRALNWMNDGATGGIKDMSYDGKIGKDGKLSFEGHAIPGDNDFGASLKLIRGNSGYISMDYGNFRKWYDIYGGYFSSFTTTAPISQLTFEPELDIGHFNFEISIGTEDDSTISFSYERNTKDVTKSR